MNDEKLLDDNQYRFYYIASTCTIKHFYNNKKMTNSKFSFIQIDIDFTSHTYIN